MLHSCRGFSDEGQQLKLMKTSTGSEIMLYYVIALHISVFLPLWGYWVVVFLLQHFLICFLHLFLYIVLSNWWMRFFILYFTDLFSSKGNKSCQSFFVCLCCLCKMLIFLRLSEVGTNTCRYIYIRCQPQVKSVALLPWGKSSFSCRLCC